MSLRKKVGIIPEEEEGDGNSLGGVSLAVLTPTSLSFSTILGTPCFIDLFLRFMQSSSSTLQQDPRSLYPYKIKNMLYIIKYIIYNKIYKCYYKNIPTNK